MEITQSNSPIPPGTDANPIALFNLDDHAQASPSADFAMAAPQKANIPEPT
jgi:hypothetical protein